MRSFCRVAGATVHGAGARLVDVQVSIASEDEGGESAFRIVGLPDHALREGRERLVRDDLRRDRVVIAGFGVFGSFLDAHTQRIRDWVTASRSRVNSESSVYESV